MTRRFPNHPRKSIVDDRPIASKTRETARFCLWPFQSCNRSTRMCACPDTGGTSERASSRDVSDRSAPDRDASDRGSERGPLFHPSIVDAPPPTCRKSTPSSVPRKMRNEALDSGDVFAKKTGKGTGHPTSKNAHGTQRSTLLRSAYRVSDASHARLRSRPFRKKDGPKPASFVASSLLARALLAR